METDRRTFKHRRLCGEVQVEARVRWAESYGYQAILDADVSALICGAAWNHVFDKHTYGVYMSRGGGCKRGGRKEKDRETGRREMTTMVPQPDPKSRSKGLLFLMSLPVSPWLLSGLWPMMEIPRL